MKADHKFRVADESDVTVADLLADSNARYEVTISRVHFDVEADNTPVAVFTHLIAETTREDIDDGNKVIRT